MTSPPEKTPPENIQGSGQAESSCARQNTDDPATGEQAAKARPAGREEGALTLGAALALGHAAGEEAADGEQNPPEQDFPSGENAPSASQDRTWPEEAGSGVSERLAREEEQNQADPARGGEEAAHDPASGETPGESGGRDEKPAVDGTAALPLLSARQDMPPTFASHLYGVLAFSPLLTLSLMLALQTIFSLDARALWFSDEVRHADAFRYLLEQGKGVILYMNGVPYPDKPPLYFWFLRGLYEFLRSEGPMLHLTGAALSALLYLWAALALGRVVARVDRRSNFAAGVILLSTGYVMGLIHYGRMDLLFAALILCSHILLYKALTGDGREYLRMAAAFLLAGAATLVKGPLGLAFPLCSALLFMLWRLSLGRLLRPDFLIGLLAGLIPAGVWLLLVYFESGSADFILDSLLRRQVLERAVDTFHHKESWNYYLIRLPLLFLPWTLLLLCLPWRKFLGAGLRERTAAVRSPEKQGLAFLWCMLVSGLVLLSCLSGKILIYCLPLMPAVAILGGRAALGLNRLGAGILRYGLALLLLGAGLALLAAGLMLFGVIPMPDANLPEWRIEINGAFFLTAGILLVCGSLVWVGLSGRRPEGPLLVMALCCTSLGYPIGSLLAPAFDPVMSPKNQALLMAAYGNNGYLLTSYKVYGGTYSFYAGRPVRELENLKEAEDLAGKGKVVVALSAQRLAEWKDRPESFREVHRQWIESRRYVLLASPPEEGLEPAPLPYKPGRDLFGGLNGLDVPLLREILEFFHIGRDGDETFAPAPPTSEPGGPDVPKKPAAPGAGMPADPKSPPAPKTPAEPAVPTPPASTPPASPPVPETAPETRQTRSSLEVRHAAQAGKAG
ncbi:MAG: dolichyl-phosphate-mannose--protein mannosyltransferase [Desulfovibrio sp.]|jgi:4-amino-4-deoxy-L-arabinose transferase-like glycosyltransferase|nr:dolichyl-phosphate-mannose--protein mannosyltransferase [Desulfovibrio sp.]